MRVDFDGDQFLGTDDLEQTLKLLTRDELAPDEVSLVSSKVAFLLFDVCKHAFFLNH
jgi:hypothetical protein